MKIDKALQIVLAILMFISILSVFTALTFTDVWVRNSCYMLTVLFSVIIGVRLTDSRLKYSLIFLPSIFFLALFILSYNSFSNRRTDIWRTSWISHRKGKNYVAGQMLDIGGMGYSDRIVKIVPLTPLFNWVTTIDTMTLDQSWTRTFESSNPYNLK